MTLIPGIHTPFPPDAVSLCFFYKRCIKTGFEKKKNIAEVGKYMIGPMIAQTASGSATKKCSSSAAKKVDEQKFHLETLLKFHVALWGMAKAQAPKRVEHSSSTNA